MKINHFAICLLLGCLGSPVNLVAASENTAANATPPDCVFPGSNAEAPDWVCDAPVKGYALTVVGSAQEDKGNADNRVPVFYRALLSALDRLVSQVGKINLENTVNNNGKFTEMQQTTALKLGHSITLSSVLKSYGAYDLLNKSADIERIHVAYNTLTIKCPAAYSALTYVRVSGKGDQESVFQYSNERGKACDKPALEKALAQAGLAVVNLTTSPKGEYFLLLGAKKASDLKTAVIK